MADVVVIDDDKTVLHMVSRSLEKIDIDVAGYQDPKEGLAAIQESPPDAVVLDIVLPETSGLTLFTQLQEIDKRLPVILITADNSSNVAIEAMRLGAFDYIAKPLDLPALNDLITKAIDTRRLMKTKVAVGSGGEANEQGEAFIGSSSKMLEVFKAIGRVASQDVTVLIRGESGTGKELVARAIYQHSHRAQNPFMAVNCAALPDTLLESELFGHEKGAFTGADRRRIGKFEQCHNGTLVLDEVGDMSPLLQGKVLRLLQEQRFERLGGNETIETNVRLIAATNRDLEEMGEEGEFRSDLLYRLNGVTISLPPLRVRKDDLPQLMEYFLAQARAQLGKHDIEGISPEAFAVLSSHNWPGNVRELQSVIQRSVLNASGPVIVPSFLPDEIRGISKSPDGKTSGAGGGSTTEGETELSNSQLASFVEGRLSEGSKDLYNETVEMMERYLFARVLQETDGNQSKAAEILGITRGKVRDRIAAYSITVDKSVRVEEND
ncbi:Regulatory protein AtoC (Acetoacetate metabolism regulatory protein) (DNA-binding transcriptional regulator AtoC) (Ornithine decarboxylase antizyme) [Durusdinium trenchii]|uniref:DNA-binding transcriptional regulator NtrC n=1 Tax=Durusdinium trenchii TaxID=1381693 RepID=A0ABP0R6X6_9DINO